MVPISSTSYSFTRTLLFVSNTKNTFECTRSSFKFVSFFEIITMEQCAGYQKALETIRDLTKQQSLCSLSNSLFEKSAIEVEEEIEEFFEKCFNALACRKSSLLKQVTEKLDAQRDNVTATRAKLEASILSCNQLLQGATMMYSINQNVAEGIWKEIANVSIPNLSDMKITADMPAHLISTIKTHGKVDTSNVCSTPPLPVPSSDTLPKVVVEKERFETATSITTIAGGRRGKADGQGSSAAFNSPTGICWNPRDEYFYITDGSGNSIRKMTTQGEVSTFSSGTINPRAIALHMRENIFYIASGHTIVQVSTSGATSVFVGGAVGYVDGPISTARFNTPTGIAFDQLTCTMFVSDSQNHVIRKITPEGEVSTVAGSPGSGCIDGSGKNAKFSYPCGICFEEQDKSLFVCDFFNDKLRKVHSNGDVSTVCSIPKPVVVTVTANGTILVTSRTHKIFKITRKGENYEAMVLAGSGKEERVDGSPQACGFNWPYGIAVHESSHSCILVDYGSNSIRKISFSP